MLTSHINKIIARLLMLASRLGSVSYADHPTAGDLNVYDPSKSHSYLPLPPGR